MISFMWFANKGNNVPLDRKIVVKKQIDGSMYVGQLDAYRFNVLDIICRRIECKDLCEEQIDVDVLDINDIKYWADISPRCACGNPATMFVISFDSSVQACYKCMTGPDPEEHKCDYCSSSIKLVSR